MAKQKNSPKKKTTFSPQTHALKNGLNVRHNEIIKKFESVLADEGFEGAMVTNFRASFAASDSPKGMVCKLWLNPKTGKEEVICVPG